MMLFTQVTRCPHCQTSFRVSDEHLEAANGVVRCGSCLQVFKATDYLVNENQAPKPSEPVLETAFEPTSEIKSELNSEPTANPEALKAEGTTSSIRFMPEEAPAAFSFTFADDGHDDALDADAVNADSLTDEIQAPVHSEPEPEPEQNEVPLTEKPQEFPEIDHFSDKKAAKHKAALASHLVDLSADDDDDEPDLDLDGELLFSDDGVVAIEPEAQSEVQSEVQLDQEFIVPSSDNNPELSSIDFSDDSLSDDITQQSDEDNFADLLDDAMAEADLDNNASLDDLLETAEAKLENSVSSISAPDLKTEPIPNSASDDDDIRFHDDMESIDHLAELLGEDTPPESKTDHFAANIADIVSDDYNDIMFTVEKEEYDDNEHEDKWALELLGASEQKSPARYQDDIEGPDLDSIEEFESSGALSFSQIHEQNRSSSNRNSDSKQDPLASSKTDINKDNAEYVDDYVDEYSDDFVDDYIDNTVSDPATPPVVPDPFDEEIDYSDRLSNSANEQGFASEFDHTPEGQAVASNIVQSREIEIPNISMMDAHELDLAPSSSSNNLVWSLLALVFIAIAAAQVAWFRFETAARSETWRPMYEQICGVIGCQLPGIQNINLIRATNTVFNTHRSDPTGIVVDTLLTNTAQFPQPYPDIELEFRDLNGRIVAQRTFAPSDYLAGEVLPGDSMPTDIPVHIALEIVNPGPEAVSRQIFIRANQ